jgi:hypothetical protein
MLCWKFAASGGVRRVTSIEGQHEAEKQASCLQN